MLSADAGIQYSLAVNTELAYSETRKLEIILIRCLGYAERLTGDPNLRKGINTIQQTIVALKSLQQVIRMTQLAAGPIGWAMLLTSAVATGISMGNVANSITMMDMGE